MGSEADGEMPGGVGVSGGMGHRREVVGAQTRAGEGGGGDGEEGDDASSARETVCGGKYAREDNGGE